MEAIERGGRFRLAGRTLEVDGFQMKGGPIEVRARVRVNEKGAFGKALASYGAPSAGIELQGKERDVHLIRPEHWFESC